jgi:hypothetical protein
MIVGSSEELESLMKSKEEKQTFKIFNSWVNLRKIKKDKLILN